LAEREKQTESQKKTITSEKIPPRLQGGRSVVSAATSVLLPISKTKQKN